VGSPSQRKKRLMLEVSVMSARSFIRPVHRHNFIRDVLGRGSRPRVAAIVARSLGAGNGCGAAGYGNSGFGRTTAPPRWGAATDGGPTTGRYGYAASRHS